MLESQNRTPDPTLVTGVNGDYLANLLLAVHGEEGIWFVPNTPQNEAGERAGTRYINLDPPVRSVPSPYLNSAKRKQYDRQQDLKVAQIALNEAFHQVGKGYRDENLYPAWAKWKGVPVPDYPLPRLTGPATPEAVKEYDAAVRRYITFWSGLWHAEMDRVCNFTRVPVK